MDYNYKWSSRRLCNLRSEMARQQRCTIHNLCFEWSENELCKKYAISLITKTRKDGAPGLSEFTNDVLEAISLR